MEDNGIFVAGTNQDDSPNRNNRNGGNFCHPDSREILSQVTVHKYYARYDSEKKRRETWKELVERNMMMHINCYPKLAKEIREVYEKFVITHKVYPSMRSMQFGGRAIERDNSRMFNCCYAPVDDIHIFSEIMFLSLLGTGVGYSVQKHHVEKLPVLNRDPNAKTYKYLVSDCCKGWSDCIKVLLKYYFGFKERKPVFDFSDIRHAGSLLKTSGGRAPGPQPLRKCLVRISRILDPIPNGTKLIPIQCHDIICHIADAVLAGGVRRSALIAGFSMDDEEMINCKSGKWWESNEQRGRANNSAIIPRNDVTQDQFEQLFKKIKDSGSGEPGIYFTNNMDWFTNPCSEIALEPFQFCNLCEINVSDVDGMKDFVERCQAAAFIGTLQAGYTDFYYIRPIWKEQTEKSALLGVSMTGIASNKVTEEMMREGAAAVCHTNMRISQLIGIKPSERLTCVKPAGTTSCVAGTSSGIHAWHAPYFIRRLRIGKIERLYDYLIQEIPDLIDDDVFDKANRAVLEIPMKAPDGSIFRSEPALHLLERVKSVHRNWIKTAHVKGDNTHNVSCTVSIKEDEWEEVRDWMWNNRDCFNGLAVLPHDGGTYQQAPFEDITKERYEELVQHLVKIDLTKVIEEDDTTARKEELACAGGNCELK